MKVYESYLYVLITVDTIDKDRSLKSHTRDYIKTFMKTFPSLEREESSFQ